jgi:hypothetical protein
VSIPLLLLASLLSFALTMKMGDPFGEWKLSAPRTKGQIAVAEHRIGMDSRFLERYGLKWLEEQHGARILNNAHGTIVYECEPPPRFVHQEVSAVVGKPEGRAIAALRAASQLGIQTTDQEKLAYDLYSGSFFQPAADARFLMLMMALETLIE